MAIKNDIKAWAIKLRGRSLYQSLPCGMPYLYGTKHEASNAAHRVSLLEEAKAEPVRVRVRIEEIE